MKKSLLPSTTPQAATPSAAKVRAAARPVSLLCLLFICCCYYLSKTSLIKYFDLPSLNQYHTPTESCSQANALFPDKNRALWDSLSTIYGTETFKSRAIDWIGGAVRVPTESFDDMGTVEEDSRWDVFASFHTYLLETYPRIHSTLQLKKVNTYGLLYLWPGSDASLKPILLAAHQDVVPVDPSTVGEWTHPPYSGYFDGERLWGRGSLDDKSGLIGILSSVESLIEGGFHPTRTIVLAFGFDEEISGQRGAEELSKALLAIFGEDGIGFVIDEGGGFVEQHGSVFALPGIAEKGYLDVQVEVTAPGGHSSIPPTHTSIGILSALLVEYEANPYEVHLTRKDPLYSTLQCFAQHAKELPSEYRKVIKRAVHSGKGLRDLEKVVFKESTYKSLVGTTQAIDVIHGGIKANALPERAWALVNHRISVISSVNATKAHDINLLWPLARQFNLTYTAFGERISVEDVPSSGELILSDAHGNPLEPAPVTPTGKDAAPYQLLSGTIKAAYNSYHSVQGKDNIIVSPSMPSGNSDTRFYWGLTRHIYRYNHLNEHKQTNRLSGLHTINESIKINDFLEMILFFTTLILNADEATSF